MSFHPRSLYRPSRLTHIKLEGPQNTPDKLRPASTDKQPVSSYSIKLARTCPNNGRFVKYPNGDDPPNCRTARDEPHTPLLKRRRSSAACIQTSQLRDQDENSPFYLTLIDSCIGTTKGNVGPDATNLTARTGVTSGGGSSNNNNRGKRVFSGRRLRQLINIASLTSLIDTSDSESEQCTGKKNINPAHPIPLPTKPQPHQAGKSSDTQSNPYPETFLEFEVGVHVDLAMARLCASEEKCSASKVSSGENHSPPDDDDSLLAVHGSKLSEGERRASKSTVAQQSLAHQVEANETAECPPTVEGDDGTQQKEIKSNHGKVWDSILRRRNAKHENMTPETKHENMTLETKHENMTPETKHYKRATSSLVNVTKQNTNQKPPKPETSLKSKSGCEGKNLVKLEGGPEEGSSGAERKSPSRKERFHGKQNLSHERKERFHDKQNVSHERKERFHDKQNLSHERGLPVQTAGVELKASNTKGTKANNSPHRKQQKSYTSRRKQRPDYQGFQDMKSLADQESPPEVIYPPYFKLEKGEAVLKKCTKSTLREPMDQQKRVNHRKHGKTTSMFWQSLMGDGRFPEKLGERKEEPQRNATNRKSHGRQHVTAFRESLENKTVPDDHVMMQKVGGTEVNPTDAFRSCQVKGYEIVRRLSRGKFRENISLYLASNESNPKFSPVEITVVTLPTRSCVRSFVKTLFTDNFAATDHRRSTYRQLQSNVLPTHTNLLTRLHVFSRGSSVYQVSSHCSWPTLASLLQPSLPESPPRERSPSYSPIKAHRYHGGHARFLDRPAYCSSSNYAYPDAHKFKACGKKQKGSTRWESPFRVVGVGLRANSQEKTGSGQPDGAVSLEESTSVVIFRQICEGLKHLHDHDILHSDLNCSNVLVSDKLQVKLTGYGPCCLRTSWESSPGECYATPLTDPYDVYLPPEIITRRSYKGWTKSSDIWCLGITLMHMALGDVTPEASCAVRLKRAKQFKTLCLDNVGYQLGLLLESLLQLKPPDRPTVDAVLEHAWFSDGTDLASEIDRQAQQLTMRADGRTFPLPKRIRQAFSTPAGELAWEDRTGQSGFFLEPSEWTCQEGYDTNGVGSGDRSDDNDKDKDENSTCADASSFCDTEDTGGREDGVTSSSSTVQNNQHGEAEDTGDREDGVASSSSTVQNNQHGEAEDTGDREDEVASSSSTVQNNQHGEAEDTGDREDGVASSSSTVQNNQHGEAEDTGDREDEVASSSSTVQNNQHGEAEDTVDREDEVASSSSTGQNNQHGEAEDTVDREDGVASYSSTVQNSQHGEAEDTVDREDGVASSSSTVQNSQHGEAEDTGYREDGVARSSSTVQINQHGEAEDTVDREDEVASSSSTVQNGQHGDAEPSLDLACHRDLDLEDIVSAAANQDDDISS